ncbi:MAG: hypothetical protein QOE35_1601 [Actinomycetota bacterium]|jgi:hypothetical protein
MAVEEIDELRAELAELRRVTAGLQDSNAALASQVKDLTKRAGLDLGLDDAVSRRGLLRKAGVAAAAGTGLLIAGARPAAATPGGSIDIGYNQLGSGPGGNFGLQVEMDSPNDTSGNTSTLYVHAGTPGGPTILGSNRLAGSGVGGHSTQGSGLHGTGAGNAPAVLGENFVSGDGVMGNSSHHDHSGVYGVNTDGWGIVGRSASADRPAIWGDQTYNTFGPSSGAGGAGVLGTSAKFQGVAGVSGVDEGVVGVSNGSANGVHGYGGLNGVQGNTSNASAAGVYGQNDGGGYGLAGRTNSAPTVPAVLGDNTGNGPGVQGRSANGVGVWGTCNTTSAGVEGSNTWTGPAVRGLGTGGNGIFANSQNNDATFSEIINPSNNLAGVHGKTAGGGSGVYGEATGAGIALRGAGGRAQLLLTPGSASNAPASGSHLMGEVYLDVNGVQWLCVGGGSPGTWVRGLTSGDGGAFAPLSPTRILDTRSGSAIGAGAANEGVVQVTGVGGIPATATAVALNITVTQPTANGDFLTVYPDGTTRPTASNLNFNAGQTVANFGIVKIGTGGRVRLYNQTGTVHVILDAAGFYR